ncbi:hypothetical protein C8R44DRAFT_872164 [Mycena epipterygia]|nr:hypothetical protein C8R44DRAFT_872164 [Mycena epipterygia]
MAPKRRQFPRAVVTQKPTASERATARAHLADIDTQILALANPPRSLIQERALLKERLADYAYPVLTLPNEIVAEIFIHFLPLYPRRPPTIGLLSPTTLGQICQKWREIAFCTPMLWRAISLHLAKTKRIESNLAILQTWLKRSGSCPLSIRLVEDMEQRPELDRFLHAIMPHCTRWEYLRLRLPSTAASLGRHDMPLLRSLEIGLSLGFETLGSIPFLDAPLLHKVTLQRYHSAFASTIPWAQLTTLVVGIILLDECVGILNCTTTLVHCRFNVISFDSTAGITHPIPKPLQRLESLVFTTHIVRTPWSVSWPEVLSGLTLPALHLFQISEKSLGEDPITPLLALISRSGCSLKELYITDSSLMEALYRTALPAVPKVVLNCPQNINSSIFADDSSDIEEVFYNESSDSVSEEESDGGSDESW